MKKTLAILLSCIMLLYLCGCGASKESIAYLIPTAEEYISQYQEKGLIIDGQDEDVLYRGLWNNDEYYRTQIDLSGLSADEPYITTQYTENHVKNDILAYSSETGIDNYFSYLFEPISVFLDNFKWSVNNERELIEKLLKTCVVKEEVIDSQQTEERYVCDYTENNINYYLNFKYHPSNFTKTTAMIFTVKILNPQQKYITFKKVETETKVITDSLAKGDIVEFGKYIQDDSEADVKENIQWYVLKVENNQALLLSKYILDGMCYKDDDSPLIPSSDIVCKGWHDSDVRKWLNNTFYEEAFSKEEQSLIATTKVKYEILENQSEKIKNSGNVKDKVFLLDAEELPAEIYIKTALPTEYSNYEMVSVPGPIGSAPYWIKNRYERRSSAISQLGNKGMGYFDYSYGVRPAIWVNLEEK